MPRFSYFLDWVASHLHLVTPPPMQKTIPWVLPSKSMTSGPAACLTHLTRKDVNITGLLNLTLGPSSSLSTQHFSLWSSAYQVNPNHPPLPCHFWAKVLMTPHKWYSNMLIPCFFFLNGWTWSTWNTVGSWFMLWREQGRVQGMKIGRLPPFSLSWVTLLPFKQLERY